MNSNKLCIVACFTILTCVSHANEVIRNVQFNMKIVGNWTVLNFTCLLYRRPIGDAVLIQINSSTVDVIRYKNNTCYDRDKECQNDTCFCSDDGHTFKIVYWYKKPKASRSYNFGIETLLNDSKANIVTVTLSRFYNGQGFEKLQIVKETSRYNFMETIDQTDNSLKNECSKLQTNSLALSATNGKNVWIALPTSMLIVFYLLCICLYHAFDLWRNRKYYRLKSLDSSGETNSVFKATDFVSITIVSTAVDIRNVDNKLLENSFLESCSEDMPMLHQKSKMRSQSNNSKGEICLSFIPGSSNEEEQMRYNALDEQLLSTCILGQMVHGIRSNVIPKKICGALQSASVPTMGLELMYSDCIGQWMYPTQCHYDKKEERIKPRVNIRYLTDGQEPPVGIDCTWKDVVSYEAEEEYENYWLLEEEGYHHFEGPVIIAGEQDNDKTIVARFLVGKGPTKNRISTGGIDVCNGLFYIDHKTEEWLYGKQDFTLSEIAISRSIRQEDNASTQLKENVNKAHLDKFSPGRLTYFVMATDIGGSEGCSSYASFVTAAQYLTYSVPVNNDAIQMSSVTDEEEHSGTRPFSINTNDYDESKTMKNKHSTYNENGNQTLPEGNIVKLNTLIEPSPVLTTQSTETKHRREYTLITPGKVFLESTTERLNKKMAADVDLYVSKTDEVLFSDADGSRNFNERCPFEQYLPGKNEHTTTRDNLTFRINTNVTFCKESGQGFPEIMIGLTHKDNVKAVEIQSGRMHSYHEKLLFGRSLFSHLDIKGRFVVNQNNKRDREMANSRKNIIEQAIDQPPWDRKVNTCFIPCELESDTHLYRNVRLITTEHRMNMINCDQSVKTLTENELQVFLNLQHSLGRILYFEEAKLNQHISIAQTHSMDALNTNVNDMRYCKDDRLSQASGDLMSQKGVIGKCIIINNYKFENDFLERKGSDIDADELLNTFRQLNYKIESHEDISSHQIIEVIDTLSQQDHSRYSSVVICILSHGGLRSVYGVDEFPVPVRNLTEKFTGSNCKSLAGKPKLFVVQACRGGKEQVVKRREGTRPVARARNDVIRVETDEDETVEDVIPDGGDFLLAFCTALGCSSYRYPEKGSYFIQTLCEQIQNYCMRVVPSIQEHPLLLGAQQEQLLPGIQTSVRGVGNQIPTEPSPFNRTETSREVSVNYLVHLPRPNEGTRTHDATTVLLLGAAGSGKSTLINAMMTNIAGVSYNDDCRFSFITKNLEDNQRPDKQFWSQTSAVIVYRIQTMKCLDTSYLNIIDTPGFGDSRNNFDKRITYQIKELFKKTIKHPDVIVLPLSTTRLTNAHQHVLSSILKMFSHDRFRFNNVKLYSAFSSFNDQLTNTEFRKGRTTSFSGFFPKIEVTQKTTVKSSKEVKRAEPNLEIQLVALEDKLCQKDQNIVHYKEGNTVKDAFE